MQGCQLSKYLNLTVATGANWKIPIFWGPLLRYVSVPILAMILSFSYPSFNAVRHESCHIVGFIVANMTMLFIAVGWLMPKFYDPFVPVEVRGRGHLDFVPNESVAVAEAHSNRVDVDGVAGNVSHNPEEPAGCSGKAMAQ
jgi:solute carrier family 6 GABA transporter-like protein 1